MIRKIKGEIVEPLPSPRTKIISNRKFVELPNSIAIYKKEKDIDGQEYWALNLSISDKRSLDYYHLSTESNPIHSLITLLIFGDNNEQA